MIIKSTFIISSAEVFECEFKSICRLIIIIIIIIIGIVIIIIIIIMVIMIIKITLIISSAEVF